MSNFTGTTDLMSQDLETDTELPIEARAAQIGADLKRNITVTDKAFDRLYPADIARASGINWTSIPVAMEVAKFFSIGGAKRVLDIGSGCGKFCTVGALTSSSVYTGVDRSRELTEVAKQSALRLKTNSCDFINADAFDLEWENYSCFYLFNPFDLDRNSCVDRTLIRLRRLPTGIKVATYYGFGGTLPSEFKLIERKHRGGDFLDFWIKCAL